MRTIETKVYKFSELGKKAKDRAIEILRNDPHFPDHGWYEPDIEHCQGGLAKMGYEDSEIMFSGFWSQGDGASFTATVDLEKWLKDNRLATKYRKLLNVWKEGQVNVKITRSTAMNYVHEYMMDAEVELDFSIDHPKDVEKQAEELQETMTEFAREVARKIYKSLEESYNYHSSEDAAVEEITANEWEFTKEGKVWSA